MAITKLSKAFKLLRKDGIVCKSSFWCCQTCGCADIENHKKEGDTGYCFYHKQDADTKKRYGEFYLTFGVFDDNVHKAEVIGKLIVDRLTECGCTVVWNGSSATRIKVSNFK